MATTRPRRPASTVPPTTARALSPVTFAFAGDVHFEGVLRSKLDADPAKTPVKVMVYVPLPALVAEPVLLKVLTPEPPEGVT